MTDGEGSTVPDWLPKAVAVLLALALLAPVFGWAAGQVGYAEPLENAAEHTGATDDAEPVESAPFPDYGVPGLGSAPGTFVSALVGTGLTLLVAFGIGRVLGSDGDTDAVR
ncbi:PDGLE domain-containing protein [Halosimplex litoreum]|uniref:PDGLE domain-containing protein n=1 Tax=Halosimplex litoreum TaxID=1198301 RepID=A0A7T3KWJ8_9EURY|nr:PDGLE domain-containing protein [Halosimplex litoreum]QPV64454.1 PDGLE domain-containing protein [Halosimplex litoreum]